MVQNVPKVLPLYCPGEKVLISGSIEGVVERLIYCRGMQTPLYQVEWWHEGLMVSREFHEADLEALE